MYLLLIIGLSNLLKVRCFLGKYLWIFFNVKFLLILRFL